MSHDLWVVGGEQRPAMQGSAYGRRFLTARVLRVRDGEASQVFEYRTPPERRAGIGSHCFKAATFESDRAYLCTDTEVLVCRLPDFQIETILSLPCFNDLHHVTPGPRDTLYVVSTGLDAVAEITLDGELLRLVDVLGGSVADRFPPNVDYRLIASTKPHRSHPNFVFFVDGEPWVTRFHQSDAVPLSETARPPRPISEHGIHEGIPRDGQVLFTGVDDRLIGIDRQGERVLCVDLDALASGKRDGGWCRGLLPLGDQAWVGYSRIRFTSLRRNLSWLYHGREVGPHALRPTRVALYDLAGGALLTEIVTEAAGLHAIFSIHPVTGDRAST